MVLKLNPLILAGAKFLLTNSTARNGVKFLIESAFDSVRKNLCPSMNLKEIAKKYLPQFKNIIYQCQNDGLKYQAGRFKIIYFDEKSFVMNFDLYFTDSDGKWINFENTSDAMKLETWLSSDAKIELKKIKEKIFSIAF